jgi:GntR family transcriptional regulator/MocR family aminotransferase
MQVTLSIDRDSNRSLQSQLFEQLRGMIIEGRLKATSSMPSTRELSEQLRVSRNTVVLVYDRLLAEGYIDTRRSVGTFVSKFMPENKLYLDRFSRQAINTFRIEHPADEYRVPSHHRVIFTGRAQSIINPCQQQLEIDFWAGRPGKSSFPTKIWRKILNRKLLESGGELTNYLDPQGDYTLRRVIADHLGIARGITALPDQVIIVGGCQDGLNLVANLLVNQNSPVILENPCYQGAAYVFENCGAEIFAIDVDDNGIDVSTLPDVSNGLAYLTPSHQYPTGATLPLKRRVKILEWALDTDSYVIEDDYDSDFRYMGSPLTALKGLDTHGSVIYLGTFTKCMGPGLRLGYMIVPHELVDSARKLKTLMSNGQPWLEQAVMAEFMKNGDFDRHLRRIRQTYMKRRDHLIRELNSQFGQLNLLGLDGGMHLVWRLPSKYPVAAYVSERALSERVGVYTVDNGASCRVSDTDIGKHDLILGYCSLSEEEISEGVRRLAVILSES